MLQIQQDIGTPRKAYPISLLNEKHDGDCGPLVPDKLLGVMVSVISVIDVVISVIDVVIIKL